MILAAPERLTTTQQRQLDRASEEPLNAWMRAHLEVAVHPFPKRDALLDLEQLVLEALDPPLNLDGRPPTPVRVKLRQLRRQLTSQPASPSSSR